MINIDRQLEEIGLSLMAALHDKVWDRAVLEGSADQGYVGTSLVFWSGMEDYSPLLKRLGDGSESKRVNAALTQIYQLYVEAGEPMFDELQFQLTPNGRFKVSFTFED